MLTGLLTKYIVSLPSRLDRLVYKLILQTGWALSSTWLAIYQSLALNHRTTLTSLNPLTPRPLPLWPQNSFDSTPDTRPGITPKSTSLHWNLEPLTAQQSCNNILDFVLGLIVILACSTCQLHGKLLHYGLVVTCIIACNMPNLCMMRY